MKIQRLRIPYQGSKNMIAEELLLKMKEYKPNAKYFIDLFGGGGSMSFTAMQIGFKTIYNEYNTDLSNLVSFIFDRINNNKKSSFGIFPDEWYNFVDRETFKFQLTQHTPYSTFCKINYSFGNGGLAYLFGKHIEEWKKQGHNFIIFKNQKAKHFIKEHYKDSCNQFIDYIETGKTWQDRRLLFVNIILKIEAIRVAGLKEFFKDYTSEQFHKLSNKFIVNLINEKCPNIEKKNYKNGNKELNELKQLQRLQRLEQLQQLEQLEQLQQLERLQQLEQLERLEQNLTIHNKSYEEIDLSIFKDEEVIVYCDPPYRNTAGYNKLDFDFDKFDNWLRNNDKTIFISEYLMPNDFKILHIIKKMGLMASAKNKKEKLENLYCNKNIEKKQSIQLSLF